MSGVDIPAVIYHFFVFHEFTPAQAAGMVANVEAESGFDPGCEGDDGQACGLFQMHPDRRRTIAVATGLNMTNGSVDEQLNGVLWELQNVEHKALRKIKEADTAFNAGFNVCKYYERPAAREEWVVRGRAAKKWYKKFTGVA